MNEFQAQFSRREDVVATRRDTDDGYVFVVDLGAFDDVTVDTVDGTAIIIADAEQYEFELPDGDVTTQANNGIVTMEVRE